VIITSQALEELAVLQAEALALQQQQQQQQQPQQQQQQEQQQQQQEDDSEATDVDDAADLFSVSISIGGAAYTASIQPGETITAAAQRFCATHAQDLQRCVLAPNCCCIMVRACKSTLRIDVAKLL
jgi:protein required for attachment to host cells